MDEQSQPPSQPPVQPPAPPSPPPPPPPPAPRGMSAGAKWAIGCGIAVVLAGIAVVILLIVAMIGLATSAFSHGAMPTGNIALIRLEGAITAGGGGGGLFGQAASAEDIVRQLQKADEARQIKGILLRINSPGGSAAGSQEMYAEVLRIRKHKPVFVSMGDVAASGGYYVASASDRIFADPGTMTGSIGVISANLEMSGLFNKIGIKPEVMKEGKFKDMGSGLRPLTDSERQIMQKLLANVYDQFVAAVAEGRGIKREEVVKMATGQIYSGEQALKLKLVDELGGMRPAVRALAKRAGIVGAPKVVEFRKRSLMDVLFGDVSASAPRQAAKGLLYDRVADALTRGALQEAQ
jgi:protease-4